MSNIGDGGYVGLEIGNVPEPDDEGDEGHPRCPGCGEDVEFLVDAPTPEIAQRVFLAYYATNDLPVELLKDIIDGHFHFHTSKGKDCRDEPEPPSGG